MRSYKPQPRLQLQSSFGVHPPVATGIRRRQPFGSSPASAPLLHTRRPAHRQGEAIKPCCGGSSQQTAEARPTKELPHDSARRTVATPPPPGVEANNAVTLRQRQRQRQRQLDDEAAASSAATASAARAPQAVAATAPKAGGDAQQTAVLPAEAEAPDERAEGDVPGSVLGAVALITGSTVGAGILALPSVAAPAGFGPSTGEQNRVVCFGKDVGCPAAILSNDAFDKAMLATFKHCKCKHAKDICSKAPPQCGCSGACGVLGAARC